MIKYVRAWALAEIVLYLYSHSMHLGNIYVNSTAIGT